MVISPLGRFSLQITPDAEDMKFSRNCDSKTTEKLVDMIGTENKRIRKQMRWSQGSYLSNLTFKREQWFDRGSHPLRSRHPGV